MGDLEILAEDDNAVYFVGESVVWLAIFGKSDRVCDAISVFREAFGRFVDLLEDRGIDTNPVIVL